MFLSQLFVPVSFLDLSEGPIRDNVVEYEGVNVSCEVVYPEGIFCLGHTFRRIYDPIDFGNKF